MQDFLEQIRPEWETVEPEVIDAQRREKVRKNKRKKISRWLKIVDHWHWRRVFERTFIEIFNAKTKAKCLATVKFVVNADEQYAFGTQNWRALLYSIIGELFPLGLMATFDNGKPMVPFWVSFGQPVKNAYELYKNTEIPVFSEQSNANLRKFRDDKIKWTKALKAYYANYQRTVMDIYLIVDPKDESAPKYKILKSLGIAFDQRVFLAENIEDGTKRVVKWETETEDALSMWTKVRKTNVDMLEFETSYFLTREQPVLLMEVLERIDHTDDIFALLLDVVSQLEIVHKAGLVHADLKLDNIMKRRGNPLKYFVIDWDIVSYRPIKGIRNAVRREAYSPWWTSQVHGAGDHPTSYRYDLEELFYAIADLSKIKRRVANPNRQIDWSTDALTRWKANYERDKLIQDNHDSKVYGSEYLTGLFPLIMDMPERLPFQDIDYSNLLDYIRGGMNSSKPQSLVGSCSVCSLSASNALKTSDENGEQIEVCGLYCAALANPTLHEDTAIAYRNATRVIRASPACVVCTKEPKFRCPDCRLRYCSQDCRDTHAEEHDLLCH